MTERSMPRATRIIVAILRPLFMVLARRDWQGAERLPSDGGYVLAPNHLSHSDPLFIAHFMVDHGVTPRFLVKDGLMNTPGVGAILRAAEQIPVARGTATAKESLAAAVRTVAAGKVVTIYPEGTMTRDPDCWPMSGRSGAVRVALATGRPLVPIAQWGPQAILWPYTARLRLFPRKTVRIRVGEPVDLSDLAEVPLDERVLRDGTDRLMTALTEMLADLRGERPTGPPIDVRTVGRSRKRADTAEGTS